MNIRNLLILYLKTAKTKKIGFFVIPIAGRHCPSRKVRIIWWSSQDCKNKEAADNSLCWKVIDLAA
jgi:hypothetical protein